ncbi:hypothetical protein H0H93_007922 [Arthromyces matolae]|nr:hypothetical protein H0H93_007922 [Arthromyces matolae]
MVNERTEVAGMAASLDQCEATNGQRKAEGSMLIIKADVIDEVRGMIEKDIYYTSGVWDKEKLTILPFFSIGPSSPVIT